MSKGTEQRCLHRGGDWSARTGGRGREGFPGKVHKGCPRQSIATVQRKNRHPSLFGLPGLPFPSSSHSLLPKKGRDSPRFNSILHYPRDPRAGATKMSGTLSQKLVKGAREPAAGWE